jgi:hypothetical protein
MAPEQIRRGWFMHVMLEYTVLAMAISTLGILLFGFCAMLLIINWGFQKAAWEFQRSTAERASFRPAAQPFPVPGPATRFRLPSLTGRRFGSEASSGIENGPGATPGPAPQLLQ